MVFHLHNFTSHSGNGAPTFPNGAVITGVVTATSYDGIDASSLQDSGGTTRVQANTSGAVVTGILTATSFKGDGSGLTGVESWNQLDTWLYSP